MTWPSNAISQPIGYGNTRTPRHFECPLLAPMLSSAERKHRGHIHRYQDEHRGPGEHRPAVPPVKVYAQCDQSAAQQCSKWAT